MASITGFGGIFVRTDEPKALYEWYERHLGLVKSGGAYMFPVPTQHPENIFSAFKQDNDYFPLAQKAMINLQVDDLDAVLNHLIAEGVTVDSNAKITADSGDSAGLRTRQEIRRVWQPAKND